MIFVALQNPGKKYEHTRHNAGSIILQNIAKKRGVNFVLNKTLQSFVAEINHNETQHHFYLLDTFVNLSGKLIAKIIKKENINPKDLTIIFDDVSVPIGEFRISREVGGSSHNGIKSIINNLKTNDFVRLRIGIGKRLSDGKIWRPEPSQMSEYVLSDFTNDELEILNNITEKVAESLFSIKQIPNRSNQLYIV